MKSFLSQFQWYRRRRHNGKPWQLVYDDLEFRRKWVNSNETWTHETVLMREHYGDDGKLVMLWIR